MNARHSSSENAEEVLLLFDDQHPCWTEAMVELVGKDVSALSYLAGKGLLTEDGGVYFLTTAGAESFRKIAAEYFIPCRPGEAGADKKKREARRSLLQMLLDKRHVQRWGLKEFVKPFRFELPALAEDEFFSLEGRNLVWKYQENRIFVNMAKDFPALGLAARSLPPPTPERISSWRDEHIPRRRAMEADLLYKSRYDFQAYSSFPKLTCDPCDLLNTDRFMCFFAPSPTLENERAILTTLGEFHMFLTMMRRMYMPGYVDLDNLDQDGINWLIYVYEREADACTCADLLAVHGRNLAGPAAPLEVWSLSTEALQKREGSVESIHDLLPYAAHPIWRVE